MISSSSNKQIIVRVQGGVGNQMFQYAIGRKIAIERKLPLKLDLRFFQKIDNNLIATPRSFELDQFDIEYSVASDEETNKYYLNDLRSRIFRKLEKNAIVRETERRIYSEELVAKQLLYIDGYWQSEIYFKAIESIIRKDFSFPSYTEEKYAEELEKKIVSTESVSLHIRRGDYANNPTVKAFHGVLELPHYYKAIELLKERYSHPFFFIFSDEPDWVKKNFQLSDDFEIVDHGKKVPSLLDMKLMSLCKHNVIANSSYSWWSAWLNFYPEKLVIAPKQWYSDKLVNDQVSSFRTPESWIRI